MRLFAAAIFLFAAPVFAQSNCTLVVTPASFALPAAASTGEISVTQPAGSDCGTFAVTVPVNWIHITSGQTGGSVPGKVSFTADANLSASPRSGVIRISLQDVAITQGGATCTFGIDPKSQNFPIAGGNGSFAVQANCAWSAFGSTGWIALRSGASGSTAGTVAFAVVPNTCVAARGGTITVSTGLPNPPVFAVTQEGSQDNLTLSATSATAPAAAAPYRITVNTGDGCAWSAFSDVSWMQISSGASGSGSGGLVYQLLENKSIARTGSIHVGALSYTVTQQAPAAAAVVLSTVANAGNYAADAVSPGEIVSLFGSNMGPGSIVTLQLSDGTVTNNLAGTQVFFDDVAAPMVFTLARQVSAVVPYGVAGKSGTKVQVQYQGVASNILTVPVQAATPGIFTIDTSGSGPGAILNQDNSLNSSANPALRGSVIAIYLTGGGVTTPASTDGSVTGVPPPVLALSPAVTVTLGGVGAAVKFAGGAPGSVTGLTQINVEVPAGAPTGLALPVVIKVGDFASTGAATVAVK